MIDPVQLNITNCQYNKLYLAGKRLLAVAASVGANCHPCLAFYVGKALELGIERSEIMEAVEQAKAVRKGAAASMDALALSSTT